MANRHSSDHISTNDILLVENYVKEIFYSYIVLNAQY